MSSVSSQSLKCKLQMNAVIYYIQVIRKMCLFLQVLWRLVPVVTLNSTRGSKLFLFLKLVELVASFAKSLNPDQPRQNVGPDLDPSCLQLQFYY